MAAVESPATGAAVAADPGAQFQATRETQLNALRFAAPLILSGNVDDMLQGARLVRCVLTAEGEPPYSMVIRSGVVTPLIDFVKYTGDDVLQFEACWALCNLSAGSNGYFGVFKAAVPAVLALLESPNNDLVEVALCTLNNWVCDSVQFRDHLLSQGLMSTVLRLQASRNSMEIRVQILSLLCSVFRDFPAANVASLTGPVELLVTCLQGGSEPTMAQACWALVGICINYLDSEAIVLQANALPYAIRLLELCSPVLAPAATSLVLLLVQEDASRDALSMALAHGIGSCSLRMLMHANHVVQSEGVRLLQEFCRMRPPQLKQLVEAEAFVPCVILAARSGNPVLSPINVYRVILLALQLGNPRHLDDMVRYGLLPWLVSSLDGEYHPKWKQILQILVLCVDSGEFQARLHKHPTNIMRALIARQCDYSRMKAIVAKTQHDEEEVAVSAALLQLVYPEVEGRGPLTTIPCQLLVSEPVDALLSVAGSATDATPLSLEAWLQSHVERFQARLADLQRYWSTPLTIATSVQQAFTVHMVDPQAELLWSMYTTGYLYNKAMLHWHRLRVSDPTVFTDSHRCVLALEAGAAVYASYLPFQLTVPLGSSLGPVMLARASKRTGKAPFQLPPAPLVPAKAEIMVGGPQHAADK